MAFSFTPGQDQKAAAPAAAPASNNGVPALVVPETAPVVFNNVVEQVSPFAYKNRSKSKFGVYFQSVIFLIFGLTVIATIGLFVYQRILIIQIDGKKSALAEKEKGIPKLELDQMQKLSSRLALINKLIKDRASVTVPLTILEESFVDDTVTYNRFSLSKSKSGGTYDLSFAGDTSSYDSLHQQINALKGKSFAKYFKKIVISGYGPLDKKGQVSFKVFATADINGLDPGTFTTSTSSTVTVDSKKTLNISTTTSP